MSKRKAETIQSYKEYLFQVGEYKFRRLETWSPHVDYIYVDPPRAWAFQPELEEELDQEMEY